VVGIRKGLDELKQPSLGLEHEREKEYLHNFTVRAFTWENRPEELDALNQIDNLVNEFMKEYLRPAEIIIARFNSDIPMGDMEADRLFLNLQSAIVAIEDEVTRRYLKAQFSYYNWDDRYWEEYRKPVSGTTNDREARARMETKEDRYFYFVQYAAWRQISDKVNSLKATQKYIQNQLYRRS
jgi:hypothetical protein